MNTLSVDPDTGKPILDPYQGYYFNLINTDVWRELQALISAGELSRTESLIEIIRQLVDKMHSDLRFYVASLRTIPSPSSLMAAGEKMELALASETYGPETHFRNKIICAGFILYKRCADLGLLDNADERGTLPFFAERIDEFNLLLYQPPQSRLG